MANDGCPVTRWDGPYSFRCGLGAGGGVCAIHGPFETSKDSEATPRNTPAGSRGATDGDPVPERVQFAGQPAAEAKRTEKTAGRGSDTERGRDRQVRGAGSASGESGHTEVPGSLTEPSGTDSTADIATGPPRFKPRKRTVGSIVVPELPWKRSE